MAFANEFISAEDFKKYDIEGIFKKIAGPVFSRASSHQWTIDRERNIFLLYIKYGHDEVSTPITFVLWWDGVVIVTELEKMDGSHSDRYSGHAIWGIRKLILPRDFLIGREDVIRVLKEAMLCYRSNGIYTIQKNYTVEFNF